VGAWPDQLKAIEAMKALDLLVQFDPWMSPTARQAHYVIAPTMFYEVPGATLLIDAMFQLRNWYGPERAHSQYTPAIVEPPAGSDVIQEWEFFYGVAQRMGLQLEVSTFLFGELPPKKLDMKVKPTTDQILEHLTAGGRVPLDEVKRHPSGLSATEPAVIVQPKDEGWTARMELANGDMMADLAAVLTEPGQAEILAARDEHEFPFRLLCRRAQSTYNTSKGDPALNRGRGYNPAFMHSEDLAALGLQAGDEVELRSARAAIPAIVAADDTLRRGMISMTHGFGDAPDRDEEFREIGSSTSRLMDNLDFADRYVGMPRMSNIPVAVRRRVLLPVSSRA
jgi:anaerobic selenocysteine-containing dehydrogenase